MNGAGFIAGVQIRGLALMTQEDNAWVMTGVQPGCLAEVGDTFEEAKLHFRSMFRGILFDIAEETTDYAGFEAQVRKILGQVNEPAMAIWQQAVAAVRQNEIELTGEVEELERKFAVGPVAILHVIKCKYVPSLLYVPRGRERCRVHRWCADPRSRPHDSGG